MSEPQVSKNEDASRYELHVEGDMVGRIDYDRDAHAVELTHTVVDEAHGGRGYAGKLAAFALDDIRAAALSVRPTCSYVARYIEKNPEYGSLVVSD